MSKKSTSTKQHNKRNKNRANKLHVEQGLSTVGLLEMLLRKSNHTFDELEKLLNSRFSNEQRRLKIYHNSAMARELDKYRVRLVMRNTQLAHVTKNLPQLLRKIDEFQRKSEELSDDTLSRSAQLDMAEGLLRVICKIGRLIFAILIDEIQRTGINKEIECREITTRHFMRGRHLKTKPPLTQGSGLAGHNVKSSDGEIPMQDIRNA